MNTSPISKTTLTLMIVVSIFYDLIGALFDLLHLIPVVGTVVALVVNAFIDLLAWLTFFFWFKTHGVSFSSSKRIVTMIGGVFGKMIPFLDLFAWTAAVLIIYYDTKAPAIVKTVANPKQAVGKNTATSPIAKIGPATGSGTNKVMGVRRAA